MENSNRLQLYTNKAVLILRTALVLTETTTANIGIANSGA